MAADQQYRFKIDAYTPTTIPMLRLAEYMHDLAVLLGQPEAVHFVSIRKGSTILVHKIEREAIPKVEDRIASVKQGQGPPDAVQAERSINRRLRDDNASGALIRGARATIIKFPGREEAELSFGTFSEEGSIDGVVIRIGGETDPCPVHLQSFDESQTYLCDVDRSLAKALAAYLFDREVRVHGVGRWQRDESGVWSLERFRIRSFAPLDDLPLSAVVANLRTIPGSEWPSLDDPWAELDDIRNGSEQTDSSGSKKRTE
jgi:hypothetical protein